MLCWHASDTTARVKGQIAKSLSQYFSLLQDACQPQTRPSSQCDRHSWYVQPLTCSTRSNHFFDKASVAGDDSIQRAKQAGERLDKEEAQIKG